MNIEGNNTMSFMSVKPAPHQEDNAELICSTVPPAKEQGLEVVIQEAQKATLSRVAEMLSRAKPEETK